MSRILLSARTLGLVALVTVFAPGARVLAESAPADESTDEIEAAIGDEIADSDAALADSAASQEESLPSIGEEDRLAQFTLERGLYSAASVGAFETLGGTSGVGNVQPFMVVRLGYDINDFLSVFAFVSQAYNSGNPWTDLDRPGYAAGAASTANFGMLSAGGGVVGSIRATERFAIEPHLGGGYVGLTPALTDETPDAGGDYSGRVSNGVLIAGGVDFIYLTLLTDFSAGISLNFHYILASGTDPIMGLGEAFVVRYTF